jgi:predicted Mrr-cat superfamily restriction endonuclease
MPDVQVWVVRAGVNNEIACEVEKASVIAIGWSEMGDPAQLSGRDEFKARYKSTYPQNSNAEAAIPTSSCTEALVSGTDAMLARSIRS